MDFSDFFHRYFVEPIIAHSGYNPVNTLVYALVALFALFAVFRVLKGRVRFDTRFFFTVAVFSLFGSCFRVVVDAVDSGRTWALLRLVNVVHQYDYSFFTVSPGIYLVVASLFFLSLALERVSRGRVRAWWVGAALALFHFALLVPLLNLAHVPFVLAVLVLAILPFAVANRVLPWPFALLVFAHALDGAATFITLDVVSSLTPHAYMEQHVVPKAIAGFCGGSFFCFYLVKVALSFAASLLLVREADEEERFFLGAAVLVLGLAPGVRDLLRMWCGV